MRKLMLKWFLPLWMLLAALPLLAQQVTVTGTVTEKESGEGVPGATVAIKGRLAGTITDYNGDFVLQTNAPLPFTLQFSMLGMSGQEVEVTEDGQVISVVLVTQSVMADELVISASRVEEKLLQSSVSIEKMDPIAIRQAASSDYYNEISKLKGVYSASGSMNFTSINTRGFATIANTRFVQLMDGMDNAAPLLNFPTGNIVGISELDIHNVELVPGAASALYGPNAFNGILLMSSKNPFDYQGFSANMKGGFTRAQADGEYKPLYGVAIRYAKAIKNKVAFKGNFAYSKAQDWPANDYTTDRLSGSQDRVGAPNFDGLNTYGDETRIFLPFAAASLRNALVAALTPGFVQATGLTVPQVQGFLNANIPKLGAIDIRRTGIKEETLQDTDDATSIKADVGIYGRIKEKAEVSYIYKIGQGSSVYQGGERYALRNFSQQFHKAELTAKGFMLRSYMSQTNAGDSYNHTALGALTNEAIRPTAAAWAPTYAGTYAGALLGAVLQGADIDNLSPALVAAAHAAARNAADAGRPAEGSPEMQAIIESVRAKFFQKGGASFIDNSRLFHTELTYDFGNYIYDKLSVLVGGNHRMYSLFTDGTIFNEDPDGTGVNERIKINEYGAFLQAMITVWEDRLKLTGSIRYDKNENFKGQITPRVSAVVSLGENKEHNIRASYQTGFRNPDTQAQYIYFPTTNILLGGTRANAERYGLFEGGAMSKSSYDAFIGSAIAGQPNPGLLEVVNLNYIKPENLTAIEVGYKTLIQNKLFIDLSVYYNMYKDFITQVDVVNIAGTTHKGNYLPGVNDVLAATASSATQWRPYVNADGTVKSWGVGVGATYALPKGFQLTSNYNYTDFNADEQVANIGFNTPRHRVMAGTSNRNLFKSNVGYEFTYRWQDDFTWFSSFGNGDIDAYSTLDAQINYTIPKAGLMIKAGTTNLVGDDYRTNYGGPFVGRTFYVGFTFDEMMQRK
jgi:iron complex outermembrane recepter protein